MWHRLNGLIDVVNTNAPKQFYSGKNKLNNHFREGLKVLKAEENNPFFIG